MTNRIPFGVQPMLPTLVPEPFDRPGWAYEEKYHGDRILAYKEDNRVRLFSRNGKGRTDRFPRIAEAIRILQPSTLLLDGEVVVFDKKGVSRFQLLQQGDGEPAHAVFDCLFHEGKDLRPKPLSVRRDVMERSIGSSKVLLPSHRLAADGLKAFRIAQLGENAAGNSLIEPQNTECKGGFTVFLSLLQACTFTRSKGRFRE